MTATRRRGAALEEEILDAGWEQLTEQGYSGFTFEAIAERAKTGKAVLYRRWPDKDALLLAVLSHSDIGRPAELPDTGSLRDDMITLLRAVNDRLGTRMPALFSTFLGAHFDETQMTPAQLRVRLLGERSQSATWMVQRAIDSGEIPATEVPDRVASLPFDLLRHELIMTLGPVPEETIIDIVDTVFLPLVRQSCRRDA